MEASGRKPQPYGASTGVRSCWTIRRGDARTVRRHSSRAAYRGRFYLFSDLFPERIGVFDADDYALTRNGRDDFGGGASGPGRESPHTGGEDGAV